MNNGVNKTAVTLTFIFTCLSLLLAGAGGQTAGAGYGRMHPPSPNPPPQPEPDQARAAMAAALTKFLDYYGYQATLEEVRIQGEWAYGAIAWPGETPLAGAPVYIIARRGPDGAWQALMPDADGLYRQWLDNIPEEFMSSREKEAGRAQTAQIGELPQKQVERSSTEPVSRLPGATINPPAPLTARSPQAVALAANAPPLVSDSLLLFAPDVIEFNIQSFLETQNSSLSYYQEDVNGAVWSAAEIIRYNAMLFGINPQTIMVILEAENKAISAATAAQIPSNSNPDLPAGLQGSFYYRVNHIARQLLDAYDQKRYGETDGKIVFNDGKSLFVDINTNAGTFAVRNTLAQVLPASQWAEWSLGDNPLFIQQFESWFGAPLTDSDSSIQSTLALPDGYQLPFPVGETWYYTGGPHTYTGSGSRPWSSIDLAQPEQVGCPGGGYLANRWIVAAKGGNVIQSSTALVVIDHGDGWRTYYLHVATPDRRGEGGINQGDRIGHPSCELDPGGGTTNGIHVHFAIWRAGTGFVDIAGSSLSGWLIQETTHYNGTMTRNGVVRTATMGRYNGTNDILNSGGPPPGGGCTPGNNEAAFFTDPNYGGQCVTKGIGDYANPASIGLPNDAISSIRVGGNTRVVLCRDDNFGGTCETFTGDDANLGDNAIGDNQVSSARVQPTGNGNCSPGSNEIALFTDANYGGQCVVRGAGNYRNPAAIGLPNDAISSIRVGSGALAVLCQHDNYGGTCETFTGDDPNLSDNGVGNDSASSAWVDATSPSWKVLLYEHPDFQGAGCGLREGGAANVCSGFNDVASSIRILPGWSARVWVDSDFNGASRCLTAGDANLADNTFEGGGQMDNRISSLAAYNQSSCPPLPPNTPSNLAVTGAAQNSLTLSWQDNSSDETGFKIYKWDGASFVYLASVGANVTTFTDAGLNCGATYFYEVSAYNGAGESPHTPWASGVTDSCPSTGPLAYRSFQVDDDALGQSSGNGDGVVNPGETIELYVELVNQGVGTATGVNATLGASDPYVSFLYNTASGYPDIGGGGTAVNYSDWDFTVDAAAPDGHVIAFCLDPITANEGGPWSSCFDVTVQAQDTAVLSASVTPNPLLMDSGEYRAVTYTFGESGGTAVHLTQREALFTLPDGVTALSSPIGPYSNDINIPGGGSAQWTDNIYLPPDVVSNAAAYDATAVLLRTTFSGVDEFNRPVSVAADLQINLNVCHDTTEPNDTPGEAISLTYGQTRSGYVCPAGDVDYYTFNGAAGDKIIIDVDAMSAGSLLDSYIFLLDSDGATTLAQNDDEIMGDLRDSILGYELPHDGWYYIKLRAWDHPSAGGADYFYDIRLFTDEALPSVALTSHADAVWLNPDSVTLTAVASDDESGVKYVYFWWHDSDWANTDWVSLGADYDGRDGWQMTLDTAALPEQGSGAIWVSAFDWAGNRGNDNAWSIGIDRTAPVSAVQPLPAQQQNLTFPVYWSGSDNLSGAAVYDAQYRDSAAGMWTNWLAGATETSAMFTGKAGYTYYFRVRARDAAGNLEAYPAGDGDAMTTIDAQAKFVIYLPVIRK